jgi:selenocysteine-specific elongation factor
MRTIGGGSVVDPFSPARRRNPRLRSAQLAALDQQDPQNALVALLACSPAGVDLNQFERAFNLTAERIQPLVQASQAAVVGKEQPVALPRGVADAVKQQVMDALTKFHRDSPQAVGTAIEGQRKALAPELSAATFTALLRELSDAHKLEIAGSMVRLPQHVATANPADEKMWQVVKPVMEAAGFNVPPLRELAPATKIKDAILKDFLHRKSRTNEIIRVTAERFYPRTTLAQLAAVAQAVAQKAAGGQFTAAQYRDYTGLGRSLAIEILECLDRLGVTQRIGDLRKMRKDFVPILGAASAPPPAPPAKNAPQAKPQAARPAPHHFKR